jgi:tRNA threonylcarbamoyladenosine biosynthesis protein TsaB
LQRVLAIDTSTWWAGVALVERPAAGAEPVPVAESGFRVSDSHAVRLLGLVERVLCDCGWTSASLDAVIATRGPGSFTGIRIGLGTVQGLALATGRAALGISTLEALAEAHGRASEERVPVLAAGRGEVYAARYEPAGTPPGELDGPALYTPRTLLGSLRGPATLIVAATSDPEPFAAAANDDDRGIRIARGPVNLAVSAARLAFAHGLDGEDPACSLAPLYVRPSDAELGGR